MGAKRGLRGSLKLSIVLVVSGAAAFAGCDGDHTTDNTNSGAVGPLTDAAPGGNPGGRDGGLASPDAGPICTGPACEQIPLPPSNHAIRLTHAQWENTTRDLLQLPAASGLSSSFPSDPAAAKDQFGTDSGSLIVTSALWQAYQSAAEALSDLVTTDPVATDRLLPTQAKAASNNDVPTRIAAFVADFLPKAYRRPVTASEISEVITFAQSVAAGQVVSDKQTDPFLFQMKWILAAALQSSSFVYRVEGGTGTPDANGRLLLGPYEIASKLSYTLWGTMPDATVTAYAAGGMLSTKASIATIAKQMIADKRMVPTLEDFHDQLFLVTQYAGISKQTALFPRYYPALSHDAQEDVRETVKDLVIDNPGGVKELYTSTTAYVNAALAPIYDIDPAAIPALVANPTSFVRVDMDKTKRLGILAHAGWLALEGKTSDPNTIQRGVYVARHVLCFQLGSPPAAAAGKDPSQIAAPTNRQRVTGITAGCGDGCHGGEGGIINPLGFGFEEFDSLGAYRTTDNSFPIDSSGNVDGVGMYQNEVALMGLIEADLGTHACYAAHWNAYLNGNPDLSQSSISIWLAPIIQKSAAGASVREIIGELVQTDAYLTVSGP
jgi:hypothetical protein